MAVSIAPDDEDEFLNTIHELAGQIAQLLALSATKSLRVATVQDAMRHLGYQAVMYTLVENSLVANNVVTKERGDKGERLKLVLKAPMRIIDIN